MSRWIHYEDELQAAGKYIGYATGELEARQIEAAHNADCDAYEARIADLEGKLEDIRMNIGCARGQRTTQYCAELAGRDKVIADLLAMLEPGPAPNPADAKYNPTYQMNITNYQFDLYKKGCQIDTYNRALEIVARGGR